MDLGVSDYYNLYSGTGVINDPDRYLRRPRNESPESFGDRAKWSSFPNYCKKSHSIYMGYLFAGKPKIEDPNPDFCILSLAKQSSFHALIGGYCWIIVLPIGPAVYRADAVKPIDQTGLLYSVQGLNNKFTIDLKNQTLTDSNGDQIDFLPDQLILVTWNNDKNSLFADVGLMNIEIFNLNSAKKYHIMKSLHWFIEGPENIEEPEPYSYIGRNNDQAQMRFIQQDNSSIIKTINEDINDMIMQIGSQLGISSEFQAEIKFESGFSKMVDMIDTNAIIKNIAANISKAVNKAAATYARLVGGPITQIEIDPILRPTENEEKLNTIKWISDFINVPEITKLFQKEALKIGLPNHKIDELEELFALIESNEGQQKRDFLNDLQTF